MTICLGKTSYACKIDFFAYEPEGREFESFQARHFLG
jgi:hypothetical protein